MTVYIGEDMLIRRADRPSKVHRVFSTNGDVLTHCSRWIPRKAIKVVTKGQGRDDLCRSCER